MHDTYIEAGQNESVVSLNASGKMTPLNEIINEVDNVLNIRRPIS